jgi:hypothetical protein
MGQVDKRKMGMHSLLFPICRSMHENKMDGGGLTRERWACTVCSSQEAGLNNFALNTKGEKTLQSKQVSTNYEGV